MFRKDAITVGFLAGLLSAVLLMATSCRRSEEKPLETTNNPALQLISTNLSPLPGQTNFAIRSFGAFQFTIPAGWTATSQETASNRVPALTVLFTPVEGNDFVVEFTALLGGNNLRTLDTKAALEKALQTTTNALERKIEIQEFKGTEISGHYFSITDRSLLNRLPPRGEYSI